MTLHAHTFILFIHICTEPTGFIIAVGNDPNFYKGSQLSLPQADNQWYKEGGDDGEEGADGRECGGVGADGRDGTEPGGVGTDDDQLLKTPPTLPPALPPLHVHVPRADPNWYKSANDSKGSEVMDICSVEADDRDEDEDVYSDKEYEKDPEKSSSDDGLNESGE